MMNRVILVAIIASIIASVAQAACPNACSQHGLCLDYDSCTCHHNYMGGDCSQRVCPYHYGWVTTPQGDLNMDGDSTDGTVYKVDSLLKDDVFSLRTQAAPGGTWETWPATGHSSIDEGHFYMECANRGICDRTTGVCKCFDGYTGSGCKRTVCPDNCNGHGVCKTIKQLAADSSTTYALWDSEMDRSCVCDAGYTGPTCAERLCPKGDDPLTIAHQVPEVQFIEIFADCTPDATTDCNGDLAGTAKFTFTDAYGESWETDPITIAHRSDTADADTTAAALEAALEAIPSDVISDVDVSAEYCEYELPGTYTDFAALDSQTTIGDTEFMRCDIDGASSQDCSDLILMYDSGNTRFNTVYSPDANCGDDSTLTEDWAGTASAGQSTAVHCRTLTKFKCVRLVVTFNTNPGDLVAMSVDTTAVTQNGKTQTQDNTLGISSTVSDQLVISDWAEMDMAYIAPQDYVSSSDGGQTSNSAGVGTNEHHITGNDNTAIIYPIGSTINVKCDSYDLGDYTLLETVASGSAPTFKVAENIVEANNACMSGGAADVTVQLKSHVITINSDISTALSGLTGFVLTSSAEAELSKQTVASFTYDSAVGYIFLEGETSNYSGAWTATGGDLSVTGAGTKENNECADRGLCDRETGLCKCFKGYSGNACDSQNALSV